MECFEVVCICVELEQESIWESEHGIDYAENDAANGIVDEREIGNIGSTGEVKFEDWWIDKRYLSGSDL